MEKQVNETIQWILLKDKGGKKFKVLFKKWNSIKELLAWAFNHGFRYIQTGLYDFGGVGGYFVDKNGNIFEPERIKEIKMKKSELRKIIKEVLVEGELL